MIILKLGGSAITNKHGWMSANPKAIGNLAIAVAHAWKRGAKNLIIVHGAGSFGHALVIKWKLNNGVKTAEQKVACAKTHAACCALSALVTGALVKKGVPAVSIPPQEIVKSRNRRIVKFNMRLVSAALRAGKVPVLFGDMVPDSKLGFSVCSGDQIVAYLGKKASRIIMASNVDGVMADGKLVPFITRKNFAAIAPHLKGSSAADVTGGMAGKIREIMAIKKPSYIVNARNPGRVALLLLGKKAVCTKIRW
ncbi:MAG: isopentenyl phosphate kinase [Candidatus Micrarchaeota archaeon]|nr:isopentenyl phosphate kinase [Candidatus Micrarchaeota archaeon]